MAWLGTWESRIKISVSNSNVDATLSNFPIQVYLSAASGIGDADVSAIFDELTSDANRKKIAVTTSDGTTQCNVEIERWDDASEKAWLWVKVPSVSASAETILYIYYDSAQSDNTTYIGDTGDTPAQNVWDSNFKLVMHMAQDPNGDVADAIKDSTLNANHGTPDGGMTTSDLVDGQIGKAIHFDGTNDSLDLPLSDGLFGQDAITVEALVNCSGLGSSYPYYYGTIYSVRDSSAASGFTIWFDNDSSTKKIRIHNRELAGGLVETAPSVWVDNTDYYVTVTHQANVSQEIFLDGVSLKADTQNWDFQKGFVSPKIGREGAIYEWPGIIDEVRISNTVRSAAWIKATHYSNDDNLISFTADAVIITAAATVPMMTALAGTGATANAACPMMVAEGLTGITAETTIPMIEAAATLSSDVLSISANAVCPMMEAAATLLTGSIITAAATTPMMEAEIREEIISEHWDADATIPMMIAELSRGPVGNIENVTVPMMTAEATFGARCEATVPMMGMDAGVTVGRVVRGEATVPIMTAELYGITEQLANADVAIPKMKASAYLYSGKIIRGDATIPMMTAEITAYQDINGDINATVPMMTAEISGSPDRAACEVLRYEDP